ncbi:MAG TPA: hypothetical protein VNR64_05255, partial [Vicinamibacterales bacterium]|nr:hypothetical protein [Vicinamibacterales bacterium]
EVVDGDVVQEIDATPPVIDVASTAAAEEPRAEAPADGDSVQEPPARGKRKRTAKTGSSSTRARKTASRGRTTGRKKSAAATE